MEIILIVVRQEMLVHVVLFEDNNQQMHKYLIKENNFVDFHYVLFLIKFEDVELIHRQMEMVMILMIMIVTWQVSFERIGLHERAFSERYLINSVFYP